MWLYHSLWPWASYSSYGLEPSRSCPNLSKLVWFWIVLLVCPKHHVWVIFTIQFLPKITNFVSEVENIGKYKFLKFTIPSYILISKVNFKIYNSYFFSIPIRNCYFLTKTEWEKCPILDILDKKWNYSKSDEFGQVCAIIKHDLLWCQKVPKTNL